MADRGCEACLYEWSLWDDIITKTGDVIYGLMAGRAFEMLDWFELFPSSRASELSIEDWDYMREVRRVRRNLEIQEQNQARESQAAAGNRTYEVE